MRTKALSFLALAAVAMGLTSCIDDKYDLEEVDYTLQVGGDGTLWLPQMGLANDIRVDSLLLPDGKGIWIVDEDYVKGNATAVDKAHKQMYLLHDDGDDKMVIKVVHVGTNVELTPANGGLLGVSNTPLCIKGESSFLQDDDSSVKARLDILNPAVLVRVDNGSNYNITAYLSLWAQMGEDGAWIPIEQGVQLKVKANDHDSKFYICDKDIKADLPQRLPNHLVSTADNVQYATVDYSKAAYAAAPHIRDLVKNVPDYVKIEVDKVVMEGTFSASDMGKASNLTVSYEVYAPLRVGDTFNVVYNDVFDGWHEDLGDDFDDVDVNTIVLEMEVENHLPLTFGADLVPIDLNGNPMPNLEFKAVSADKEFHGKNPDGTPRVSTVKYELKNNSFNTPKKILSQLDGVQLKAYLKYGGVDEVLRPTDIVKVNKLCLGVKGGIIYDAN